MHKKALIIHTEVLNHQHVRYCHRGILTAAWLSLCWCIGWLQLRGLQGKKQVRSKIDGKQICIEGTCKKPGPTAWKGLLTKPAGATSHLSKINSPPKALANFVKKHSSIPGWIGSSEQENSSYVSSLYALSMYYLTIKGFFSFFFPSFDSCEIQVSPLLTTMPLSREDASNRYSCQDLCNEQSSLQCMQPELGRKNSSLNYSLSLALLLEKIYINFYLLTRFLLLLEHSF